MKSERESAARFLLAESSNGDDLEDVLDYLESPIAEKVVSGAVDGRVAPGKGHEGAPCKLRLLAWGFLFAVPLGSRFRILLDPKQQKSKSPPNQPMVGRGTLKCFPLSNLSST